jgi:hypothetical protein
MPTDQQLETLAALLTTNEPFGEDGIVTTDRLRELIAEGFDPNDPGQLVEAFVTGLGQEWTPGHPFREEPEYAWAFVGGRRIGYRVPAPVLEYIDALRQQIQDMECKRVAAYRKHRAELADALGTPPPDIEPIPPGADAPTM